MDATNRKNIDPNIILVALLPVFVHLILVTVDILKHGPITFDTLDLSLLILLICYLCGLIFTVKRRRRFIYLAWIMYSLIFAFASIELVFRFSLNMPLKPMHRISYPAEGIMPGISGKIEFTANKYGLRGPNIKFSDIDIRILTMGGSATECLYVTDKLSWPWRLQDKLSRQLGKRVLVCNAGKSGNCTLHYIYFLKRYQLAPRFEWVILLAGVNDLWRLTLNDYAAINQTLEKETFIYKEPLRPYYRSLGFFRRLIGLYKDATEGQIIQDAEGAWYKDVRLKRQKLLTKNPFTALPPRFEEVILIYKQNLKYIIDICRKRNQHIVMLTQPTLWHKDLSPDLQKLIWAHTKDGAYTLGILEQMMFAYNQAMRDICSQEGVPCIDLASLLASNYSILYDDCHFNIHGCEVVSEIVANEMVNMIKR